MIYQQSVFEPWPIESESVQAVISSPPYYALRKYSIPDVIIGGDKDCKHEFNLIEKIMQPIIASKSSTLIGGLNPRTTQNGIYKTEIEERKIIKQGLCIHCNAWKGQYGLEPTPQMYVEHTRLWAKEAWRVLRNDGVFFLNIADSYGSGFSTMAGKYKFMAGNEPGFKPNLNKSKCQLLIPHRVAIALVDDGWTLRNTIIWYKTNGMPESVTDRFSKKYEYVFMFTKQEKYYFDLDSVRLPHVRLWDETNGGSISTGRQKECKGSMGDMSTRPKGYPLPNPLGKNPGDVWTIPTQPSSEKHFAMWPERLVERMIRCSTKAGDVVLDCFAGSATTLKVAEQLQRKGTGIDLGYHEMSKRRTSKIQKQLFV